MIGSLAARLTGVAAGLLLAGTSIVSSPDIVAKPGGPSPARKRAYYHGVLDQARSERDGVHDACGGLLYSGDASSIPHLIRVLRLFPDEEIVGQPGRGIVCTQMHCVDALEKLTGATVGVSYSSWKRWWDETHPGQPLLTPPRKSTHAR